MRKSFLLLWISVAGILLFFWLYFPTLSRYRELKIEEETIKRELAQVNEKIRELSKERDLLKNDLTYLEKVIRDELGLVKPGEIVYKFVHDTIKPSASPSPLPMPSPVVAEESN
ncbi:MAG: septum formation initiator family protein [Candidatus Omnitrophica bacterium]|nr:septum formation initiator family protein [Candidatus Omnitrophota bacterium]